MAAIQILNKETLSKNKFLLQNIAFEKPDNEGKLHKQENEIYFRPDAVSVLLVDKNNEKILLAKQFRLATYLNHSDIGYLVETCAGLIDDGETPEQAAIREVEEETGYQLADLEKTGGVYTSAGGITEYVHLFIASFDSKGKHGKGGGKEGEGEDIELIEMTLNDAREKLKQGWFIDAKTVILLQHWFLNQ